MLCFFGLLNHAESKLRYAHFVRRYREKWSNILRFSNPSGFPCCDDCQAFKTAYEDTAEPWPLSLEFERICIWTWVAFILDVLGIDKHHRLGSGWQIWNCAWLQEPSWCYRSWQTPGVFFTGEVNVTLRRCQCLTQNIAWCWGLPAALRPGMWSIERWRHHPDHNGTVAKNVGLGCWGMEPWILPNILY